MRIRLPLGRWLFLLVAFLVMLLLTVPLRIALDKLGFDERGLGARSITGTLWSGTLTEARLRSVALGDLEAGLSILPLFIGQARMSLETPSWSGVLVQSGNSGGVSDLNGKLGPEALASGLPVNAVEFEGVNVTFRDGVCAEAAGTLRVEPRATSPAVARLGQLTGPLRCDGDAVLAPLVSGSGQERIDFRIFGDGRYRLSLMVPSGDPATTAALTAAGFAATADGLTMTSEGSF